jgi:hypothetical protein
MNYDNFRRLSSTNRDFVEAEDNSVYAFPAIGK